MTRKLIRIFEFFLSPTSDTCAKKISTGVNGGLSGGSSVRRPGSEDPHRRQRKFVVIPALAGTIRILRDKPFLPGTIRILGLIPVMTSTIIILRFIPVLPDTIGISGLTFVLLDTGYWELYLFWLVPSWYWELYLFCRVHLEYLDWYLFWQIKSEYYLFWFFLGLFLTIYFDIFLVYSKPSSASFGWTKVCIILRDLPVLPVRIRILGAILVLAGTIMILIALTVLPGTIRILGHIPVLAGTTIKWQDFLVPSFGFWVQLKKQPQLDSTQNILT